jgi:flavin-dependent dehydrogenase
MTAVREVEVLVVGAGPAGAVAAASLAGRGAQVLLAHLPSPGGQAHDVIVTAPALCGLVDLGVTLPAPVTPVTAVDLRLGGTGRTLAGAEAVVCDGARLRERLLDHAAAAGAQVVRGEVTALAHGPSGRLAAVAGQDVLARHVVIATGAAGYQAIAPAVVPQAVGIACARRFTGPEPPAAMLLTLSAPAVTGAGDQPLCGWALPGAGGTVTIGAARLGGAGDPAELLATALATHASTEPCLAAVTPAGPLASGPLNPGFSPDLVAGAGCILAGEAAGLVNPFTGEGFSYAVRSGLLAAAAIAASPGDPDAAQRSYARRLAGAFAGYFETARHASRRYHLAWRVLAAATGSDHPFFTKARRAIVLPEEPAGPGAAGALDLSSPETLAAGPFLASCNEVAITTVRREWPFLAHLALTGSGLAHHRLRPALLFLAALRAGGAQPDIRRATPAAAIELATLGALAFICPPEARTGGRGVDWAVTTTVLAGDFLFAQASRLIAESAPEISWSFADWLAELAALRAAQLGAGDGDPGATLAALLEFPARVGAVLGGADGAVAGALREAGHQCGRAFGHAEDILALRGERTRLDGTLAFLLRSRISAIPRRLDGHRVTAESIEASPALRIRALAGATAACLAATDRALRAAGAVPDPMAAQMLRQFARSAAAPATILGALPGQGQSAVSSR